MVSKDGWEISVNLPDEANMWPLPQRAPVHGLAGDEVDVQPNLSIRYTVEDGYWHAVFCGDAHCPPILTSKVPLEACMNEFVHACLMLQKKTLPAGINPAPLTNNQCVTVVEQLQAFFQERQPTVHAHLTKQEEKLRGAKVALASAVRNRNKPAEKLGKVHVAVMKTNACLLNAKQIYQRMQDAAALVAEHLDKLDHDRLCTSMAQIWHAIEDVFWVLRTAAHKIMLFRMRDMVHGDSSMIAAIYATPLGFNEQQTTDLTTALRDELQHDAPQLTQMFETHDGAMDHARHKTPCIYSQVGVALAVNTDELRPAIVAMKEAVTGSASGQIRSAVQKRLAKEHLLERVLEKIVDSQAPSVPRVKCPPDVLEFPMRQRANAKDESVFAHYADTAGVNSMRWESDAFEHLRLHMYDSDAIDRIINGGWRVEDLEFHSPIMLALPAMLPVPPTALRRAADTFARHREGPRPSDAVLTRVMLLMVAVNDEAVKWETFAEELGQCLYDLMLALMLKRGIDLVNNAYFPYSWYVNGTDSTHLEKTLMQFVMRQQEKAAALIEASLPDEAEVLRGAECQLCLETILAAVEFSNSEPTPTMTAPIVTDRDSDDDTSDAQWDPEVDGELPAAERVMQVVLQMECMSYEDDGDVDVDDDDDGDGGIDDHDGAGNDEDDEDGNGVSSSFMLPEFDVLSPAPIVQECTKHLRFNPHLRYNPPPACV
jgi:hypothetical protein